MSIDYQCHFRLQVWLIKTRKHFSWTEHELAIKNLFIIILVTECLQACIRLFLIQLKVAEFYLVLLSSLKDTSWNNELVLVVSDCLTTFSSIDSDTCNRKHRHVQPHILITYVFERNVRLTDEVITHSQTKFVCCLYFTDLISSYFSLLSCYDIFCLCCVLLQ